MFGDRNKNSGDFDEYLGYKCKALETFYEGWRQKYQGLEIFMKVGDRNIKVWRLVRVGDRNIKV